MNKIINILTFHHINPNKDELTIPPEIFEQNLVNLSKNYEFISYDEFIEFSFFQKKLNTNKKILLTIDDGYLDNYIYAYPILKKLNIPAVIFTITNNIQESSTIRKKIPYFKTHKELNQNPDKNLFFNTEELKDMLNSKLITIDSHTTSHLTCKSLGKKILEKDFESSLNFIKKQVPNRKKYGFCWPKGAFDNIAMKFIIKSNYDFAFSTTDGSHHIKNNNYSIKRIDCSSFNGNNSHYMRRLRRKLWIYSNPIISNLYSNFREYRIKLGKK